MDMFSGLASGFALALTPEALMYALIGVLIGTVIGVLPGIGPITTIALLIPLSFGMEPVHGLILLCAIYYGSMYGGSITATLIRTPGEVASVVTAIDGYEMARRGRAGPALATAAIGSFIAGTAAVVGLMVLSPMLVKLAVFLGAQEYFLLMLLALMMASTLTTGSRLKAWLATCLGLAVGVIGLDPQTGTPRETFGFLQLQDGIDFAIFAMALFAVPEAINSLCNRGRAATPMKVQGRLWMSREDWRRSRGPYARGSVLGFLVGVMPGIGPSLAAFMSYVMEKRLSRHHKEEFGKGAIEGVAGPESANNAGVGGAMVPLLSLGIPGSATTALLLFVFMMYGLQPGPLLFQSDPGLVWAIIASMYVGNVVLLALNLPLVGVFVKLLSIPGPLLFSGVLAFVVLGAYALSFSLFSMLMLLVFGVVGFLMEEFDIPLAPAVLALVLEPLLETNLRRGLQVAGGDLSTFVARPASLVLLLVCLAVAVTPLLMRFRAQRARSSLSMSM